MDNSCIQVGTSLDSAQTSAYILQASTIMRIIWWKWQFYFISNTVYKPVYCFHRHCHFSYSFSQLTKMLWILVCQLKSI